MQEEMFSGQGFSILIQGRVGAHIPYAWTHYACHSWVEGHVFVDGLKLLGPVWFFQGVSCYLGCAVVFADRRPFPPLSFLLFFFVFPLFFSPPRFRVAI